jgi:hypothetical protein
LLEVSFLVLVFSLSLVHVPLILYSAPLRDSKATLPLYYIEIEEEPASAPTSDAAFPNERIQQLLDKYQKEEAEASGESESFAPEE